MKKELDKIAERLDTMNTTLVRNTTTLEHHVKRTDILEAAIQSTNGEVQEVQKHVAGVRMVTKVSVAALSAASAIVGIIYVLSRLL